MMKTAPAPAKMKHSSPRRAARIVNPFYGTPRRKNCEGVMSWKTYSGTTRAYLPDEQLKDRPKCLPYAVAVYLGIEDQPYVCPPP